MANVDIEVASRSYSIACRDGEEAHLRSVAALVDRKAKEAEAAVGGMAEARHLLFTSLLLADELKDMRAGLKVPEPEPDPAVADALERLAGRLERLAGKLESRP